MTSCCVKWCGKNSRTSNYKKDGITFHRFPENANTKSLWIEATERNDWFPAKTSVICSRHFTTLFLLLKNRKRLLKGVIPTMYLPHMRSGYVDFGAGLVTDCNDECTEALVFLIVPIKCRFKVLIGYFLTNGTKGEQKATLVKKALELCHDNNVNVKALTFDGCPELKLSYFNNVEATSRMILLFTDLFDRLDSKVHGYGFKRAINEENHSKILEKFDDSKDFLMSLTTMAKSKNKASRIRLIKSPCFTGFLGFCIAMETAKVEIDFGSGLVLGPRLPGECGVSLESLGHEGYVAPLNRYGG
ncbi:hypothetical protein ACJJTC_003421 [Scirpophaga incertulas]